MCGIIGYTGNKSAKEIVINGLKTLEYRGYDSAGIAFVMDNHIEVYREVGRIVNLEEKIKDVKESNLGLGHTRWATHGKPTVENAHPHTSMNNLITLVHNGVIENYLEIKEELFCTTIHGDALLCMWPVVLFMCFACEGYSPRGGSSSSDQ